MKTTEQQHARNVTAAKWDKDNTKQVKMKLNCKTDADVLAWLEKKANVQGYIKSLIRADMAARGGCADHAPEEEKEE